ncbi:hypothetical protein FACS189415_4850 [Bacteroidia bacterium]|nr:hypothetical protein FACS189426_07880 [Bacteroidia bacterium]GHT29669.1 hypothetical protein FACS189432_08860 [Bacteroidia bacterium]GHU83133.1 hypothetical protein FACS189415_4850 [Bacteroidia bacterium]GHV71660.1 hypothetical protein FACS189420_7500 [Bacteroidia bacterium]
MLELKDIQKSFGDVQVLMKQEGKTILQIEHNNAYIDATSDQIFQLEKGVVVC